MNLRIYFPDEYSNTPKDNQKLALRLECFNSVDGSSRLVILLGWFRFVCSNGMVIGETKTEFRDIHNKNMDLERIPKIICQELVKVKADKERLRLWEKTSVGIEKLKPWVNKDVSKKWGKKAACRVYHICKFGHDVKITDPFAPGDATDKPTKALEKVPGALEQVTNLYDVSQALSWVVTQRKNTEERLEWQTAIPELIQRL